MFAYDSWLQQQIRGLKRAQGKQHQLPLNPQMLNSSANIFPPNRRGPTSPPPHPTSHRPHPHAGHIFLRLPSRGDRPLNGFIGTVQCLGEMRLWAGWAEVEGILSLGLFSTFEFTQREWVVVVERSRVVSGGGGWCSSPFSESLRLHPLHPLLQPSSPFLYARLHRYLL